MLSKPHRLIEEKDFKRVMKHGRSFFVGECGIKILKKSTIKYKNTTTRIGIVVPKKLTKTIVKRNRIKRQIRHIFIELLPRLRQGYDIVFLTREGFLQLEFEKMKEKIISLLSRAQVTDGDLKKVKTFHF